MRLLFSFVGGSGHFLPLAPVARAAVAAGHTVAFACGPSMAGVVAAAGFTVYPLGAGGGGGAPERLPLRPVDMAREEQELRDRFVRGAARSRVPLALALCAAWRPDAVVCDETDFGGMLAAELLGIPHATVLVMAAGSFVRPDVVGAALDELRAEHGLPADPGMAAPGRHLALSPFPPGFRDPAFPPPPTTHALRLSAPPRPRGRAGPHAAPLVYFTLGTIFNVESGDLFARVLAGLRQLPVRAVVTVGDEIDPAELGPQPARIRVERYVPQAEILPACSAVISHGGSGSVLGTLAHGLPAVLIPMGADQPLNAARAVELGLGLALDPLAATPEAVRDAVAAVLDEPRYRLAAERLRDEIAGLPGPESAVPLLERLGPR